MSCSLLYDYCCCGCRGRRNCPLAPRAAAGAAVAGVSSGTVKSEKCRVKNLGTFHPSPFIAASETLIETYGSLCCYTSSYSTFFSFGGPSVPAAAEKTSAVCQRCGATSC